MNYLPLIFLVIHWWLIHCFHRHIWYFSFFGTVQPNCGRSRNGFIRIQRYIYCPKPDKIKISCSCCLKPSLSKILTASQGYEQEDEADYWFCDFIFSYKSAALTPDIYVLQSGHKIQSMFISLFIPFLLRYSTQLEKCKRVLMTRKILIQYINFWFLY